ncbi:MAG: sugar ABC transporter ATP-binding protein [Nocardiopsaceae bacterium]|nr:sugar ABC transporter ATP-binding protein [Nocardiopsaceae bacterium]
MTDSPAPLLELRDISKSYGQVQALRDVSFTVGKGETVGLFGDNGAGKSTLVKIMAGVERADAGSIFWEGKPAPLGSRRASAELGIEPIYQDGALCESMPIWRNVFLGREDTVRGGFLRTRRMRDAASDILRSDIEIGAHIDTDRLVSELSGGQRQAVAIARAVHFKRSLLLLDEPTSALAVRETEALLGYVRRLRDEGVSSVLITHNLHQAYQVCERFVVMSRGRVSLDAARDEVTLADLTNRVLDQ